MKLSQSLSATLNRMTTGRRQLRERAVCEAVADGYRGKLFFWSFISDAKSVELVATRVAPTLTDLQCELVDPVEVIDLGIDHTDEFLAFAARRFID